MNRLKRRARRAAMKGCYVFKRGSSPLYSDSLDRWDVYVESEGPLGPRDLKLTRRQAIGVAYAISVAKRPRLEISTP